MKKKVHESFGQIIVFSVLVAVVIQGTALATSGSSLRGDVNPCDFLKYLSVMGLCNEAPSEPSQLESFNAGETQTVSVDCALPQERCSSARRCCEQYSICTNGGLPGPTRCVDREARVIGVTGTNKVYDTFVEDPISGMATLSGIEAGDSVTLDHNGARANFDDPDVGNNKVVRFSGYELGGPDANRYRLIQPPDSTADILPPGTPDGSDAICQNRTYQGVHYSICSIDPLGEIRDFTCPPGQVVFIERESPTPPCRSVTMGDGTHQGICLGCAVPLNRDGTLIGPPDGSTDPVTCNPDDPHVQFLRSLTPAQRAAFDQLTSTCWLGRVGPVCDRQ